MWSIGSITAPSEWRPVALTCLFCAKFCCPLKKSGGLMKSERTELDPWVFEKLLHPTEWPWILIILVRQLWYLQGRDQEQSGRRQNTCFDQLRGSSRTYKIIQCVADKAWFCWFGCKKKRFWGVHRVFQQCTCVSGAQINRSDGAFKRKQETDWNRCSVGAQIGLLILIVRMCHTRVPGRRNWCRGTPISSLFSSESVPGLSLFISIITHVHSWNGPGCWEYMLMTDQTPALKYHKYLVFLEQDYSWGSHSEQREELN